MNTTVYLTGIVLQGIAALIALLQTRHAPRKLPWLLIALSSLLIVIRRGATLNQVMAAGAPLASGEILTLVISLLFFLGVILMSRMFRDIGSEQTALQEREKKLKESEERYAFAMRGTNDGLWDWDLVTNEVIYSLQWKAMLGYADDEIKNGLSEWNRLTHPEDAQRALAAVNAFLDGKAANLAVEMRMRHKDGRWLNILSCGDAFRDKEGRPLRLVGTHIDITERATAESELKKNKHFLERILWSTPNLIYIYDVTTKTNIYSNRMVLDFLGYTSEQIKAFGSALFENILHPDDAENVGQHQAKFFQVEENAVLEAEYRMKHADGTWHWLKSRDVVFLRDSQQGILQILGTTEDISKRKQDDENLKAAYTKLETLWSVASLVDADVKQICDHILASITKISGSQYGFYGFVNDDESVMTIHSWSGEAMKDCSTVVKPLQFSVRDAGVWGEAIRRRRPLILNDYKADHQGKKGLPDGHVGLSNLLVTPFFFRKKITAVVAVANREIEYSQDDVGQITGFLESVQSIIERRRAEEALQRSQLLLKSSIESQKETIMLSIDGNYRYLYFNRFHRDVMKRSYGVDIQIGMNILDCISIEEDRKAAKENYQRALKGESHSNIKKYGGITSAFYESFFNPVTTETGEIIGATVMARDVTKRIMEEEITKSRAELSEFGLNHSLDELLTKTLDIAEKMTGSSIGFFHFLDPDQKTLTLQTWSTNTLTTICTAEGKGQHYDIAKAGVWVDCVRQCRAVIHNDYYSLPHRKGMPDGHAKVLRELTVPVFRGGLIVGIVGIGNKPVDYSEQDIEAVSQLANLAWDIVVRKQAEESIKNLLHEKGLLLREVHHRIKNNMNTMLSMLSLQSDAIDDPVAVAALTNAKGRIRSMMLLYDKLYRTDHFGEISVKEYLSHLTDEIISIFPNKEIVKIEKNIEDIVLGTKIVSPLGIITNELLTNAMKYAFIGRTSGTILVSILKKEKRVTLTVQDDGVGMPEQVRTGHFSGFGLQLVEMLAKQIKGTIRIEHGEGTKFLIEFEQQLSIKAAGKSAH